MPAPPCRAILDRQEGNTMDESTKREELEKAAPVVTANLKRHVFVCTGKSCSANDSQATLEKFWEVLKDRGLLYGKRGSLEGFLGLLALGDVRSDPADLHRPPVCAVDDADPVMEPAHLAVRPHDAVLLVIAAVPLALRHVEDGRSRGKVVITMDDPPS